MQDRILSGWTFQRAFYVLAGLGMVLISLMDHQWPGIFIGGYFASMGLFAFGCASGNCFSGACKKEISADDNPNSADTLTKL
jgi:hypothetical protein